MIDPQQLRREKKLIANNTTIMRVTSCIEPIENQFTFNVHYMCVKSKQIVRYLDISNNRNRKINRAILFQQGVFDKQSFKLA